MEENKSLAAGDSAEITLDGFGLDEARELKQTLVRFLQEYGKKPAELSDEDWLCQRFLSELPDMEEQEARDTSRETFESIQEYNQNLASLRAARAQGSTAEEWFADKSREAASGVSAVEFGRRMEELSEVLGEANAQLYRTVTTKSGAISQQLNLDGFLAEQQAVNSFNAAAKLEGSSFRAEVCVPKPGETYGKNSFDAVIKNKDGRIVHQYQFKYGKDAETTIQMIKRGNYNNQTLVVPPEQVEKVRAAFPGKTVVSYIGGTEKVSVSSASFSKADVKATQETIQSTGKVTELDWESFDNQMLTKYVGRQAMMAGVQGAALGAGFSLVEKLVSEEPVEVEDVVVDALRTGADTSVKAAAAGAIRVAAERGALGVLQPLAAAVPAANLACVAVENVKTLGKVATGDLTPGEAIDEMGGNTTAMYCGMSCAAKGAAIGASALGAIPVVGPIVGGVVGGVVGYAAGSKVGQTIYNTAKKVAKTAVKTVKKVVEGVKKVGEGIKQAFNGIFQSVGSLFGLA